MHTHQLRSQHGLPYREDERETRENPHDRSTEEKHHLALQKSRHTQIQEKEGGKVATECPESGMQEAAAEGTAHSSSTSQSTIGICSPVDADKLSRHEVISR